MLSSKKLWRDRHFNIVHKIELLNRITTKIRQSLELQTVLDTAVTEVRAFLKSDRVKIYKFDEDGNGRVIAEQLEMAIAQATLFQTFFRLPSKEGLWRSPEIKTGFDQSFKQRR